MLADFGRLLLGTVIYRPYVYGFFACFLVFAVRHLGARRTGFFMVMSYVVAYVCEYSSTRNGFPFGLYTYLDGTRSRELWLSNVPFWDSLSFVFLSYFSFVVAAYARHPADPARALREPRTPVLGGSLMMLLDVVIDPLSLRGDRWFLGKIYFYPNAGPYFGVTIENFLGWWFVGWATQSLFQLALARWAWLRRPGGRPLTAGFGWGALGVYAGVFLFNWAITLWIREWALFAASSAVMGVTLLGVWAGYRGGERALPRSEAG